MFHGLGINNPQALSQLFHTLLKSKGVDLGKNGRNFDGHVGNVGIFKSQKVFFHALLGLLLPQHHFAYQVNIYPRTLFFALLQMGVQALLLPLQDHGFCVIANGFNKKRNRNIGHMHPKGAK